MEKKMTKKEMFAQIKAHLTNEAEIAFIDHEIELLEKKNGAAKKPTKTQVANEELKGVLVSNMEDNMVYTVTDIIKNVEGMADLSNQKVSALLRQLVEEGKVTKVVEKRKSYFQKVVEA